MTKVKTNFSYHKVDVGLDVHKRSWNAAVFLDGVYVRSVHQPPSPKALYSFLTSNFPGVIIVVLMKAANLVTGYSGSFQP